jgi:hypothetical protein
VNLPPIVVANDIVAALGAITNAVAIDERARTRGSFGRPSTSCRIYDHIVFGIILYQGQNSLAVVLFY